MISTDPLRIAVPKGRLLPATFEALAAAGCAVPPESELRSRRLVFDAGGIEWILVKDCDVPVYVEHGAADAGVAGFDQIREQESTAYSLIEFPFGRCRMSVIAAPGIAPLNHASTIATKYPRVARQFLDSRGLHAEVIALGGSVELAAVLELTTHVIDLVQSGETIAANGLAEQEIVMDVSPRLIVGRDAYRRQMKAIRELVSRIEEAMHGSLAS
jgi:ATP phosphoribosyltransferase